ncbi:MAG: hybrid sensor histidine kinase/response regulator [Magnetococcales bacterium]|nr:hybrid sensor histidine kinase/response regulator [Magnetococcales bacterium]
MCKEGLKQTIMIVDDLPGNIKTLANALKDDYRIVMTTSGAEAIEIVRAERVDLVLLDVVMPGMDGYEVLKILKSSPETESLPVIFVTSKSEPTDETEALSMGAVDFISKPVIPAVVQVRVKTHLQLKEAHQSLERQNRQLREAARLREDFDHIMRHDLKTPLYSIIGFTDILMERLRLEKEERELFKIINESSYKLVNMINLSLDLLRMEQGTYSFIPKPVDLLRIVEMTCSSISVRASSKKLDFRILMNGSPPESDHTFTILGEETLCYSIISNLLQNAVDASPKRGVVTVDLTREPRHEVRIHNHGVIPPEIRGGFFEKYTTFGKHNGMGLGTYSAKKMVEIQGGRIRFETDRKRGTTLMVQLLPC